MTRGHVRSLGADRMVADALQAFAAADRAPFDEDPAQVDSQLRAFYQDVYLPQLAVINDADPVAEFYFPDSAWDRYLQNLYLRPPVTDPASAPDEKIVDDGSAYGEVHRRFHPALREIKKSMDSTDIFLIGPNGRVLYTMIKEVAFRTDVLDGPFNDSGLARAFRESRRDRGTRGVHAADFSFYGLSYGEPAASLSTPVFDGQQFVGVVVVRYLQIESGSQISESPRVGC